MSGYFKHVNPETAMPVKTLKEAKQLIEERWVPLEDHLIKLVVWGDRISWRREVYAFCGNIQKVTVKLKNRVHLTKMEYLESSDEFRVSSQTHRTYFKNRVNRIGKKFKLEKRMPDEASMVLVHKIQIELSELFSMGDGDNTVEIDKILDRYINP